MKLTVLAAAVIAGVAGQNGTVPPADSVSAPKSDRTLYVENDEVNIAVLPFKGDGTLVGAERPDQIIANDLDFSDKIKTITLPKMDSAAVAEKQVRMFIDGSYKTVGDSVFVTANLKDYLTKKQLLSKTVAMPRSKQRQASHRFSNMVVKNLYMQKGPFETSLLVTRRGSGGKDIYVMDYDGFNMRRLTSGGINIMPTFIDDFRYLWVSFKSGHPDVYRGNLNSTASQSVIASKGMDVSPDYSPASGKVVFSSSRDGNSEIYSADINGGAVQRLTVSSAIDASPAWSPNGYSIAFISDRSGSPQLYVMDYTGANERRLTFTGPYHDSPVWSPDGKKIAYTSRRDGKFDIFTIALDGTEETRVTEMVPGNNEYPVWSPDGSQILFVNSNGGRYNIYRVAANGAGEAAAVTTTNDVEMPAWSFIKE